MSRIFMVALVTAVLCLPAICFAEDSASNIAPQDKVKNLINLIESGGITRIELVSVRGDVLTAIAITPASLERSPQCRLVLSGGKQIALWRSILSELRSLTVTPGTTLADVRLGMTAFGASGERRAEIFFDRSGRKGTLDSASVVFDGRLFALLASSVGECAGGY